jgi:hypothetical protein
MPPKSPLPTRRATTSLGRNAGEAGTPTGAAERTVPRLVGVVWALLVVDTLGSQGAVTIVPIPRSVIQMVSMGSVLLAFALAVVLNPRLKIRPSAYLLLLSLLVVVSTVASARLDAGYGAFFRCARLAAFVATLWLLSRWWDGTVTFVRYHIRAFGAVLVTVAVGLVVAPGLAMPATVGGRLIGAVWPLTPPQVAQYAAVTAGLAIMLWMGRLADGRSVAIFACPALLLLVLTHTRTATLGLLIGLAVGALSLMLVSGRARRVFIGGVVLIGVVAVVFGSAVQMWIMRGQDTQSFANLTGRAKVWDALLAEPRTTAQEFLGIGLTNKSFEGLPIDSSWLAVYYEQGLVGVVIVALLLVTLIVVIALRPSSPARACAAFLVTYCLVASYTEAGLSDASPYLLNLAVAAALLSRPISTAVAGVRPAQARADR